MKGAQEACLTDLNLIAILKRKFIRVNQTPFINKELHQTVMIRLKLRNKFLKGRYFSDKNAYNKQKNAYTSLLGKTKN